MPVGALDAIPPLKVVSVGIKEFHPPFVLSRLGPPYFQTTLSMITSSIALATDTREVSAFSWDFCTILFSGK